MAFGQSTGQGILLTLALSLGPLALAADPVELPPVLVPLPEEEPAPQSPPRRDPSGSGSVVEASEHQGEAKDAAELLATAPGVVVQDAGGLGQAKRLSVRGASSNGVLVLLDGIPLNGAGGNVDLGRIPPPIIERLEVLRGGAGARYGSGGLGGAVNVVTRRPESGARLFGEATQGSFETTLAHAGAAGALGGGEGLLLLHGARSAGDFRFLHDDRPTLEGNPLEARRRENNQAAMAGGLLKYRRALPGGLFADAMGELSMESRGLAGTVQNPTSDARQASQRLSGAARLSRTWEGGAELAGMAWGRRDRLELAGGSFGPGYSQLDAAVGGELTWSRLVAERHGLSATAQAGYEWLSEPTGANPAWVRAGAMVSDEVMLLEGALLVAPSLRVDQSGPFTGFSPKLGVTLAVDGFELKANVGQAHRAPSFLELYVRQGHLLPNEGLRPERALYQDVAASHRSERWLLSVGGFHSLYEDLISYEYYPPMLARPFNFSTARVYGVEAEGEARPHALFSVAASYTLLFSQNLRDDPRYYLKELPFRPRHKLHVRASAGPSWARARAEVLYQSAQFQNRTATLALPERAFVNLGVSSAFLRSPELTASLEVKNVLDVQTQDLDGYPLPPRAAYLTLSISYDAGA